MEEKDHSYDIMVFRPSLKEFAKFSEYIDYMESMQAHKAGIAKVIPPKGWSPKVKNDYSSVDNIIIPSPISQTVKGIDGVYQQYSKRKKSMTVKEFRQLSESSKYTTPNHSNNEELDRMYWDTVTDDDRIYGADVSASLFDKSVKKWNLKSLDTILDCVSNDYGLKIEGVNTTYLYFGMWKTSFPWHTEDCDLYSINYLHLGMRKVWYAIPPAYGKRFERLVKALYPANNQACTGFLRHKTTIISPDILDYYSIPYNKVEQNQGEFIITFPFGYHAGYNAGFNCAEAINFASLRWIDYGKNATKCICKSQNISISMDTFVKTYQSDQYEKWLNGAETTKHPEESESDKRRPTSARQLEKSSIQENRVVNGPKISLTFIRKDGVVSVGKCTVTEKRNLRKRKKVGVEEEEKGTIVKSCGVPADMREDKSLNKTWLDNYLLYIESRQSDIQIINIMETWSLPLASLWIHTPRDLEVEKSYNKMCSLRIPHCSICSIVKKLCDGELSSDLPSQSMSRIPMSSFSPIEQQLCTWCTISPLLVCSQCNVCVHASCYKEELSKMKKNRWLCRRCAVGDQTVECVLCCLRGGAFTKTTNNQWVHIVCALFTKGLIFLPNGNVVLGQLEEKSQMCSFCWGLSSNFEGHLSASHTIQCDEDNCTETFHVTCAAVAGVLFQLSESPPFRITKTCLMHGEAIDSSLQNAKDSVWNVGIGQTVIAKNKNNRYYYGTIIDIDNKQVYKVDLYDGTCIENLQPNCITSRDCVRNGPPHVNEKITFVGEDGKTCRAIFKAQIASLRFRVIFEDNSIVFVPRKGVFVEGQELPTKVKSKLSTATPMRYSEGDQLASTFHQKKHFKRI